MADSVVSAWIALAGVVLSTIASTSLAYFVAKTKARQEGEVRARELDLELRKMKVAQARELSDRKLDIAHRYAELRQQDDATARDFLNEVAKETAIGFLFLDDDETREKIWVRDDANILIGRRSGCDIVLNDPHISREHCVLSASEGELYVVPLNPTNDVLLNGRPINGRVKVQSGDKLQFQPHTFYYFSLT